MDLLLRWSAPQSLRASEPFALASAKVIAVSTVPACAFSLYKRRPLLSHTSPQLGITLHHFASLREAE